MKHATASDINTSSALKTIKSFTLHYNCCGLFCSTVSCYGVKTQNDLSTMTDQLWYYFLVMSFNNCFKWFCCFVPIFFHIHEQTRSVINNTSLKNIPQWISHSWQVFYSSTSFHKLSFPHLAFQNVEYIPGTENTFTRLSPNTNFTGITCLLCLSTLTTLSNHFSATTIPTAGELTSMII